MELIKPFKQKTASNANRLALLESKVAQLTSIVNLLLSHFEGERLLCPSLVKNAGPDSQDNCKDEECPDPIEPKA